MIAKTGPDYLREIAMGLRRMGFPISAPSLEQLAAQWDADLARAERAEAALEQARALLADLVACGYECEAGALENNQAYRDLAALLAAAPGGAA